jgi:glycosyltransferase involved in cell wall biosynthesis
MQAPLVSIVIETVTALFDAPPSAIVEQLRPTLAAIKRQSWPADRIETIVVVDPDVPQAEFERLCQTYPGVRFVAALRTGYFAAKNRGAAVARGEFVLLLDADCVPEEEWIERLMGRFEDGVAVVAGRTRYAETGAMTRLMSIPDFGYVLTAEDGEATGFNLNNLAYRRDVLLAFALDERIARNGACYFQFHQLRAAGHRVVYEPAARVAHALDGGNFGFVRKHFDRGYDSIAVYRADAAGILRGTRWFRRLGVLALGPIFARRIAIDWARLARHRRQIGFTGKAFPVVAAAATVLRLIELGGAVAGTVRGARLSAVPPADARAGAGGSSALPGGARGD